MMANRISTVSDIRLYDLRKQFEVTQKHEPKTNHRVFKYRPNASLATFDTYLPLFENMTDFGVARVGLGL